MHVATVSRFAATLTMVETGDEGRAYRRTRSNMLLVGPELRVDALVSAVTGLPAAAIPSWAPGMPPLDADAMPETVLVRNVHLLDEAQQHQLFEAIGAWQGRVRVIATSAAPLYPLVVRRAFHEGLYYRLNMLCLEPRQGEAAPHRL